MMACRSASGAGLLGWIAAVGVLLVGVVVEAQEQRPSPPKNIEGDIWGPFAIDDESVARKAREALPFTRSQIIEMGRLVKQFQAARADATGAPPKGRIRSIAISLGGGGEIPAIELHKDYTTVISFTDLTGQPWPIEEIWVDRRFVPVEDEAAGESQHLVYLVPEERFLHGNLVVKLRELAEPILMTLSDGGGVVDFRVDARLSDAGPNADIAALARPESFHAGDQVLQALLGGRIPKEAVSLEVSGGGSGDRAWLLDGEVLLLTRWLVLSPGPWAAERGPGGRQAYRLPATPRVLVSRNGREAKLSFKRREGVEVPTGARR